MAPGSDVIERPVAVAETPSGPSARRWLVPLLLAVGWVLSVLWRMWLSRHVVLPIAHTDEDSYLNTARALAGGPGGFSSENDLLRRVGYPMLISPAFLGDRDFTDSYRIVQLINAMVNSTLLPLAYLLGRRLLQLRRSYALLGAVAAATLPATAFYAGVAMIDAVLAPLVVAWLLAVHRWIGRPGPLAAATVGLLVGGFHLLHSRGLVIVAVHAGLVLLLFIRRRISPPVVLAALLPVLALALVNEAAIRYLGGKVYLLGSTPDGSTFEALASAQGVLRTSAAVTTQLWYLVVITFGLAGVAWAGAVRELWRPRHGDAARWTMGVALVVTVGVAGGASVILSGITGKPLDAIYGRYVQMLAPFWLLVGLGVLFTAGWRVVLRRAAVAVALLVGGGALIAARLAYVTSQGHRLAVRRFQRAGPDGVDRGLAGAATGGRVAGRHRRLRAARRHGPGAPPAAADPRRPRGGQPRHDAGDRPADRAADRRAHRADAPGGRRRRTPRRAGVGLDRRAVHPPVQPQPPGDLDRRPVVRRRAAAGRGAGGLRPLGTRAGRRLGRHGVRLRPARRQPGAALGGLAAGLTRHAPVDTAIRERRMSTGSTAG